MDPWRAGAAGIGSGRGVKGMEWGGYATDSQVYFSLGDLLSMGSMAGAKLLAGADRLGCRVARTNVVEVADLAEWAQADELIISSGYAFRDNDQALAEQLIRLQEKGVAALCLKPRHLRDGLPERVTAQARALGFPLIELPIPAVFANIVHESMEAILARETEAFRQLQDKLETLLDSLLKEDNPEKSMEVIERVIRNPLLVFDSDNDLVMTPQSRALLSGHTQEDLIKQLYKRTGRRTLSILQEGQKRNVPAHFFDIGGHTGIRIIILEYHGPMGTMDEIILRRISHVLAIELKNAVTVKKIRRKYKSQFVQNWLFGQLGDAVNICVSAQADGYQLSADKQYRVAIVNLNTAHKSGAFVEQDTSIIRHVIRNLNPGILFTILEGKLILVLEAEGSSGVSLKELALLSEKFNYIMDKGDMSFCLSDPYSVADIPEAYRQARNISRISQRCGIREQVITYERLGVLYLLSLLPEDRAVEQYRDQFLSPIKAYDAKHKGSLLETLRVYLQVGCNTQKAAQLLHSHYNTVVYRISNVERLLGLSIGDVETRLQLRIAYKLDQLR